MADDCWVAETIDPHTGAVGLRLPLGASSATELGREALRIADKSVSRTQIRLQPSGATIRVERLGPNVSHAAESEGAARTALERNVPVELPSGATM